jgi:hypothetical protein
MSTPQLRRIGRVLSLTRRNGYSKAPPNLLMLWTNIMPSTLRKLRERTIDKLSFRYSISCVGHRDFYGAPPCRPAPRSHRRRPALFSLAVVHVRLRTDIVKPYGLSVWVRSSQLWTVAARQCIALFLPDRFTPSVSPASQPVPGGMHLRALAADLFVALWTWVK